MAENRWAKPKDAALRVAGNLRAGGASGEVAELRRRVARLENEIQEMRGLNVRLAELTDVVGELLLPVAARDEEKLAVLLAKYGKDL